VKRRAGKGKNKKPQPQRLTVPLAQLHAIVERTRTEALPQAQHATLAAAIDTLALVTRELESKQTSLERLRRLLFGPRTEKTDAVLGAAAQAEGAEPHDATGARSESRQGHGRHGADAYPRAARVAVTHATLKPGDACPVEGCDGKLYEQRHEPALLVRVTGVAPLAATVYALQRLRCGLCGALFTADPPAGVGPDKYDATAAAMIALMKYGCGMPFHRLQRLHQGMGLPLPAATQWEVVQRAAASIEPVFAELVNQAAQAEVLHNDDTTARVLGLTQEARAEALPAGAAASRTGVFTTGIVAQCDRHKIALFMTGPRHAGENLAGVLDQRDPARPPPIQMSDALSRNTPGAHAVVAASCLPHARRNYVDVATRFPDECRFVLETLRAVFRNDELARRRGLDPEQRLQLHQRDSASHMEALEQWMSTQIDKRLVEPNSGLGEAIAYMQNHWDKLTAFLRVAGAPLDNNICERALKKAILHRKNSLFFKTMNGAQVGDIFMSLIHTAELCAVEPFDYLVALQRHVDTVLLDPAEWMPWNYATALARVNADATDQARD
jgi:hypothetical protein